MAITWPTAIPSWVNTKYRHHWEGKFDLFVRQFQAEEISAICPALELYELVLGFLSETLHHHFIEAQRE